MSALFQFGLCAAGAGGWRAEDRGLVDDGGEEGGDEHDVC
jgi:hypothetical protein